MHLESFGHKVYFRVCWLAGCWLEGMHLMEAGTQEVHDTQSRVLKHCEDLQQASMSEGTAIAATIKAYKICPF